MAKEKSQFRRSFDLTTTLALLMERTFSDSNFYRIEKAGFDYKHGNCYLYISNLRKVLGFSTSGKPCKELAVYYSHFPSYGDRFRIISAYTFSEEGV